MVFSKTLIFSVIGLIAAFKTAPAEMSYLLIVYILERGNKNLYIIELACGSAQVTFIEFIAGNAFTFLVTFFVKCAFCGIKTFFTKTLPDSFRIRVFEPGFKHFYRTNGGY